MSQWPQCDHYLQLQYVHCLIHPVVKETLETEGKSAKLHIKTFSFLFFSLFCVIDLLSFYSY